MRIIQLNEIESLLTEIDLMPAIESGFVSYSEGQAVVPPVGELLLDRGEVHIKYGFIESQPYYVVKIASGFYGNAEFGLPTGSGLMLLFCQKTGQLKCILLDEGHLTDVRTAIAGAIAAKYLAPTNVFRIGIVGTGIQARAQLQYLEGITNCRDVLVWGRSQDKLADYVKYFSNDNLPSFQIETTLEIADIQNQCNLIVTTTPSKQPLLTADHLLSGTHITAVGSDIPDKQELDSKILGKSDLVCADSISQCQVRGEISHALRNQDIELDELVELGNVISGQAQSRTTGDQVTIADLTGVAVQDIQIASAVFESAERLNS